MTATLLREVFGDKEAAARATKEAQSVINEADRLADMYIRMANESLRKSLTPSSENSQRALARKP
jgi:hypothetical protein